MSRTHPRVFTRITLRNSMSSSKILKLQMRPKLPTIITSQISKVQFMRHKQRTKTQSRMHSSNTLIIRWHPRAKRPLLANSYLVSMLSSIRIRSIVRSHLAKNLDRHSIEWRNIWLFRWPAPSRQLCLQTRHTISANSRLAPTIYGTWSRVNYSDKLQTCLWSSLQESH